MKLTKDLIGFYRGNKDDCFLYAMSLILIAGLTVAILSSNTLWFLILPCIYIVYVFRMLRHDFRSWRKFYGERQHDQNIQTG